MTCCIRRATRSKQKSNFYPPPGNAITRRATARRASEREVITGALRSKPSTSDIVQRGKIRKCQQWISSYDSVVGTVGRVGEEDARNDGAAADRQDCSVEQMGTRKSTPRYNNDIGEVVRRWKIQFDGFGQMSVESFIERVEECNYLARLSQTDLLLALSETMTGTAAKWYRSNRHMFESWSDFCRAARKTFGMDPYGKQQLLEQIRKRTQGPDERVAEYVICVQSVLRKLRPE
ncbi:unnamed protein product [Trichogramma brassicae]|uniref:Retrotransposon gag domain-containing protein n=1 Tax=Trichogramma brassicae TaxID=86971 RepID=A0A6H5IQ99_9HYME|nr:unnamed protein product [Trichogramma brassicae]